ncbi:c-type cytochrome [Chitinophaga sp. S165]|uniref:c-type cytochrome n=1 Tax=Chitinophaga sp. S165 TaxID=2135462 RepID=UPI000D940392|nr:cytochrome c [Chitinophaga sp. S165]PWV45875.1 cytochrome c [Chitinophaga sp. S165]
MNNLFRTCALLLLLASCNSLPSLPPLPAMLNTTKLPSQLLNINTERDTTLTLKGGTVITIPANALKAEDGIARLEVKEALTIEQILIAGLRTQSNGAPLQSGGMIYIDAAKDAKVSILKPIQIQVPTNTIVDGMQLYKGEVEKNGINWVDPQPLSAKTDTAIAPTASAAPVTPDLATGNAQKGRVLFYQNCAACHNVHKTVIGPALKGVMQRWNNDTSAVYSFIHNSGAMIASGHPYAVKLFHEYGKVVMPGFPSFTYYDVKDILAYIQDPICYAPAQSQPDSCQYYCEMLNMAYNTYDEDQFIKITNSFADTANELLTGSELTDTTDWTDTTDLAEIVPVTPDVPIPNFVIPKFNRSYYYNIEIDKFGWYNLDMLLKMDNEVFQSELSIDIQETEEQSISVFLIIPSHKIMVEGGYLKDGKLYGFDDEDGITSLPQGVKAYIVAIGENKYKPELYFGRTTFITSKKQALHLTLEVSSEADIQKQIATLQLPDFLMKTNKKEVSAQMQALRQEALRIQADALNAPCDCGGYGDTSSALLQANNSSFEAIYN